MGTKHVTAAMVAACLALSLGACANDSVFGAGAATTSALPEKPKSDPVCASLASKIDSLRNDGTLDRVEQASQGKGSTVSVKRESLAKVAELNKANTEFRQKCTAYTPAAAPTVTPGAATAPKPAKTAAVSKPKAEAKAPVAAAAATADASASAPKTE